MAAPDPSSIDWNAIALWGAGGATVLTSIGVAVWTGVTRALKIAAALPPTPAEFHKTDVYTTDSVAMHELAAAVEGHTIAIGENTAAIKAIGAEIKSYAEDRKKEQADRDLDEEVQRRVDDKVKAAVAEIERQRPPRQR